MGVRMLTPWIPSSKHHDMIYIDVDPTNFRMNLLILQGLTDLQLEISRISAMELILLKATAHIYYVTVLCRKLKHLKPKYKN